MTSDLRSRRTRHPASGHDHASVCAVCGEHRPARPIAVVPPALAARLTYDRDAVADAMVCGPCLTEARIRSARAELEREQGELTDVEHDIAVRAATHAAVADRLDDVGAQTRGQRAADRVAQIGGSWKFVLSFGAFLLVWCIVNTALALRAFDPFPFILLNLILSCLAAIQAPIIMMSQGRMSEIDRARAAQDYRINLKAELEVAALHEKLDHLLHQQWSRMVELQDLQLEILEALRRDQPA
ncbi:MAG: DUF1003 domain-containing protein [Myxococcales bacterium]|nr:DUF1003 domain-containing protein [Myxococcales bacterium]